MRLTGISLTAFKAAPIVRLTIQTVNCMGKAEFENVFGISGAHLWEKYANKYDRNAGDFICSLDEENLARLVQNALRADHLDY